MSKRKWILAVLIAITTIFAAGITYDVFRMEIIKWSLEHALPDWLRWVLWGWIG